MGGVCSLEDHDDGHGRRLGQKPSVVPAPNQPIQNTGLKAYASAQSDDRDVRLQRMWNSDVVGELVKNHTLSIVDDGQTVLHTVQAMIKQSANYCIVKRRDASDVDMSAGTPASPAHTTRKKKESYIGLFDWRDLNALLVMVAKQSRLHGTQQHPTNIPQLAPSVLTTNTAITSDAEKAASPASDLRKIGDKSPLIAAQTGVPLRVAVTTNSANKSTYQPSLPATPSAATACTTGSSTTAAAPGNSESGNPLEEYLHFLDMKRAPIGMVSNLSQRNPMQIVHSACPLLGGVRVLVAANDLVNAKPKMRNPWTARKVDSLETCAVNRQELYRLTVVDKNGLFIGCLTQLAICAWIESRLSVLGGLADESLHDLGLGQRRVMTIGWKAPVLSAITLMHEKQLSALAIINDAGKLVGTISCSDVKFLFLAPDLLLTLERPVSVFISMLRQSASFWHVNIASNPPPTAASPSVTVTPRASLTEAIRTLLATKVRRAWVVNDNEQPIGYISITDILKFALPNTATTKNHPSHISPAKIKPK